MMKLVTPMTTTALMTARAEMMIMYDDEMIVSVKI